MTESDGGYLYVVLRGVETTGSVRKFRHLGERYFTDQTHISKRVRHLSSPSTGYKTGSGVRKTRLRRDRSVTFTGLLKDTPVDPTAKKPPWTPLKDRFCFFPTPLTLLEQKPQMILEVSESKLEVPQGDSVCRMEVRCLLLYPESLLLVEPVPPRR